MKNKKQIEFNLDKGRHGGRRKNAGRPRIHSKGVAHTKREKITPHTPVHINFKFNSFIKKKSVLRMLKHAITNSVKHGLNIVHYSIQSNHIHLIAEANDNRALSRGMQSLLISLSKSLGKGIKLIERYHLHVLKSLRETKYAIHYVLFNEQKHSASNRIDEYSSLFGMKEANRLIGNYARVIGKSLVIGRAEKEIRNSARCFLLRKSLAEL